MKEHDYIISTNLAKARIAMSVVRDMMPGDDYGLGAETHAEVLDIIIGWVDRLNNIVAPEYDPD
jgi:hypothetical protein